MPTKRTHASTPLAVDSLHTLKLEHHSACQHPYPVCNAPATTVDYLIPLEDGGHNDWHNLRSHCDTHKD